MALSFLLLSKTQKSQFLFLNIFLKALKILFSIQKEFNPINTAEGWQLSNAPVLGMSIYRVSLEMFDEIFFWISSFLTVFGAIMVVFQKNLMHACIFLLCSLIGVTGLYITLSADFVAGTQLVVYVGGVIILMLFAIMLTGGNNTKTLAKIKLGFEYLKFAKEIIKNSKVKLFLVNNNYQLAKFLKKNMYGKKIVIGMGAGTISNWMRELPNLL